MQQKSIVRRLFDARRQIDTAISVISECARDEREVRKQERHPQEVAAAGFPVNTAFLVEAFHCIVARRYRARESILAAAEDFFKVCAEVDATLTTKQKLDILGWGHRADAGRNLSFEQMVGLGYEHPFGGEYNFGPLKFAGLLATTPMFLTKHEAEREICEAYEGLQRHANRARSFGIKVTEASRLAHRVAANHGYVHPAPGTVQ
ncbi:hypothetical protein [Pararobbsia alpina]|uniref:Uncharacterized protein n=1 Tax=Pararobbsia alpina TaxID=621374 RepID=A0A6S7B050_9BURK|nr:hypothetical protein [Pararobbsia alpina]CAB3783345.1 hypothetical protein LMG28138_01621 [Pararobbsia alpina]